MNKHFFLNTFYFIIAAYLLYTKVPTIITNFGQQDKKAINFTLKIINGENYNLYTKPKKQVLVFWATWCGPCEVELKRINQMIKDQKIRQQDILAISSYEEESIVKEKAKKENYLFNIGLDTNGSIRALYQVSATPTTIFIDEHNTINWMTTGLSPTLEYRINSFLN